MQFVKLFVSISSTEKRPSAPFYLVLISLHSADGEPSETIELERELDFMEGAIRQAIWKKDILTRYGTNQFLLILLKDGLSYTKITKYRIYRVY